MQITDLDSTGLKKQFQVRITAAEINTRMDAELADLGKTAKIPGFRPGNVPLKVLRQRYGKSVESDVLKNTINEATREALESRKIRPALTPDVNVTEYAEGGDLVFSIAVEALPDVPEVAFKEITLERETFTIADKDAEEALETIAKQSPTAKPLPAEAKAEIGNVVVIDFEGKVAGVAFEGGKGENVSLELGSNRFINGFEEQLVGTKAGDAARVNVTFPENYFHKDLAGKDAVFDVNVKTVSALEMPPVDDELAKSKGFSDLRALREAVRDQLIHEYSAVVRTRLKRRLFDALEEKCAFELPQGMVDMEFNAIWQRLQQSRQEGDESLQGKSDEELAVEYKKIAARRVKLGIFLAEMGTRNKLQVTREELGKALMEQASQFPGQEQQVMDFYRKNPDRLDGLRGPILEEKAVDWILGQVQSKDKEVSLEALTQTDEEGSEAADGPEPGQATKKAKRSKAEEE